MRARPVWLLWLATHATIYAVVSLLQCGVEGYGKSDHGVAKSAMFARASPLP